MSKSMDSGYASPGKKNIIREKSFEFAVAIVNLGRDLQVSQKEYVLSRQLLRSGTSIGANVRESGNAQSNADFIHKLSIAQKETDETCYWLELLKATDYLDNQKFDLLHNQCLEILKIIKSIIITKKKQGQFEPTKKN
jgi:four helix bundle protein